MDSEELDRWIEGQFLLFDAKLLKLCTMDEGVRRIRLTSDLVSRLTPLGYFDPPFLVISSVLRWAPLGSPRSKTERTICI